MRTHSSLSPLCLALLLTGCKPATPTAANMTPASSQQATATNYPPRPSAPPPPIKIAHQDNDTYTLVTDASATDDQVAAILWQFRDAAKAHTFDTLHLAQAFIDARKPTVWIHVYRGPKCASEKYTKGPLPCDASYHGAGDFTLGDYKNPAWNMGELRHTDGTETQLWDPDAAAAR